MRLPNKITSYQESIISKFPYILNILEQSGGVSISDLYQKLKKVFTAFIDDIADFIEIIDCLFVLGKVKYDEKERRLIYVASNKV